MSGASVASPGRRDDPTRRVNASASDRETHDWWNGDAAHSARMPANAPRGGVLHALYISPSSTTKAGPYGPAFTRKTWSGREDSNLRPSEPHAGKPSANVHCSPRRARSGVCWGYLGAFTPVRGRPRPSLFASHFHLNFHGISRIGRGRERPPPWPSRSRLGLISASPWRTNGAKASAFHDPTPASSTLQVGET